TSGTVTFTFRASDGTLESDPATVTITIVSGNRAPVCSAVSYQTPQDTPLSDSLSCTDADGDALTYSLVAGTAHGTTALNANGGFTYPPPTGYHGPDSFTFRASDGTAESSTVQASLDVGATNALPTAADDTATLAEDGSKVVDVLANDSPGAGEASQHLSA